MKQTKHFAMALVTMFVWSTGSVGVAAPELLDFTAGLESFSATFKQTVYDADSTPLQESEGRVELQRPGRFRWTYTSPVEQVIVADGATLWIYDEDIQQVTMQPQSSTLGSAPIGLLSGQRSLQREFSITELGEADGLRWFQLDPLVNDTDFHRVFLALDDSGLRAMELRDNFEQATQIKFDQFRQNINLDMALFHFVPPAGVDVVGEAGTLAEPDELAEDLVAPTVQNPADPLLDDLASEQNTPTAPLTEAPVLTAPQRVLQPPPVDNSAPIGTTLTGNSTDDLLDDSTTSEPRINAPTAGQVLQNGSEITLEVIKTEPVE